MVNYTALQNKAFKMLQRYGWSAIVTSATTVYDLAESSARTSSVVTAIQAADFDATTEARRYRDSNNLGRDNDVSYIQTGDRLVYVSGKDLSSEPKVGSIITLGNGQQLRLIKVLERIGPAGTNVLYALLCRV